jgi:RNA polymerase sigma factor (sigma-70 family)
MYETHESFVTPEFCQRLRAKEGTAWERLVNEWRESFIELAKGSLYRLGNSSTDPKDIVADMWSKAWIESHKLKGQSEGELYVWLKFKLVEVLPRHPKPQLSLDQPITDSTTSLGDTVEDGIPDCIESLLDDERDKRIIQAMDTLDARPRDVVTLKFWGKLSNEEIAESLGLTPNQVRYALANALIGLKFRLQDGSDAP